MPLYRRFGPRFAFPWVLRQSPVTDDQQADDWLAAMQTGYLDNLARLDAAGQLTAQEFICLQQVIAVQPQHVLCP